MHLIIIDDYLLGTKYKNEKNAKTPTWSRGLQFEEKNKVGAPLSQGFWGPSLN